MLGVCALTKKETDLRHSHIYPKFAVEWMKSIGSKYMRNYLEPNKRFQDGYKVYLLSDEAEQKFSKSEKWFSENIFQHYLSNIFSEMKYNEQLFYFSISFLWRILVLELKQPHYQSFEYRNLMVDVEEEWREFLNNGIYPINFDRIHIVLTDTPTYHNLHSESVDFFLTKSFDGTLVYNIEYKKCCLFAKFSKFIFWAFLEGDENGMIGTRINPISGILKAPQSFDNSVLKAFIYHRIKDYDNMPKVSHVQQEKILKEILKNKEHFLNSEIIRSLEYDYYMNKRNKKTL